MEAHRAGARLVLLDGPVGIRRRRERHLLQRRLAPDAGARFELGGSADPQFAQNAHDGHPRERQPALNRPSGFTMPKYEKDDIRRPHELAAWQDAGMNGAVAPEPETTASAIPAPA